jgi:hypothetical protein
MRHHHGLGMGLLEPHNLFYRELLVHMAAAVPQQHLPARHAIDVVSQVVVGPEDDFLVLGKAVNDLLGIARGHHTVGECLHGRRGVDIAHHFVARMLVLNFLRSSARHESASEQPP